MKCCVPISGASGAQELLVAEGDHLWAAEQPRLQTEEGMGAPPQGQDGDIPGIPLMATSRSYRVTHTNG